MKYEITHSQNRPLHKNGVSILGRPPKLPGPLHKLPDIVHGTSTKDKKEKRERYVAKKSMKPSTESITNIKLFGKLVPDDNSSYTEQSGNVCV